MLVLDFRPPALTFSIALHESTQIHFQLQTFIIIDSDNAASIFKLVVMLWSV
jgi:hypothetical protein